MKSPDSFQEVTDQSDPLVACPLKGLRVLIVEDAPDQQRLYAMFLQRAGAEVSLECCGSSAVHSVARFSPSLDVVVVDLKMEGLDGIQTTQQLRNSGFTGAIVAVTAHGSQEIQRRWLQAGCDAYLEKPLSEETLVAIVQFHSAIAKVRFSRRAYYTTEV